MALIADLPGLTGLYFKENLVTNAGLAHLQKLQNLEMLDFKSGANFSPRALSRFRRNMPNLVLYRDFEKRQEPWNE